MSGKAASRRTAAERLVPTLTAIGMTASLAALVSYQDALKSQFRPDQAYPDVVKPPLFYAAYTLQIALLLAAGLAAFCSTDWRTIERGYRQRFLLLMGAALLMAARGYSSADLFSTRLVDSTGPFPFFLSILVFIGARRSNWTFLGKAMALLAAALSALVLAGVAGLHSLSRQEGVASLTGFLNALYWPASWVAIQEYPQRCFARYLRFGPAAVYGLGSLFTQTRLNFIMILALLAVYSFLQRRRKVPQAAAWLAGFAAALWAGLFTAVFLKDTRAFEKTKTAASAFYSRLDEDTRTAQLRCFFDDVRPRELLFGRGALATWNWPGMSAQWRGGTDVGYLTLLFYGGVPLLATYVAAHLKPCFTVLAGNPCGSQLTAACIVLLWGVRMFSSTYPGLSVECYPILFCVGACISREPFR
jgi:hypothetical protein